MKRLTVELPAQFSEALEQLASDAHTSKTEILRRAVTSYKILQDADRDGKEILLRDDKKNKETRLLLN